jgi:pimeloyl-ACP methyl ester carboxylesterase
VPGRGEVFVREAGDPRHPTVVLLHGWTVAADLNWWRVYGPLEAAGFHVLAVDHRGHGRGLRSEERFTLEAAADDVAGLLETLGVGEAIACGYSMGGPISMLTWRRHPHLVAGLVLEATALEWQASRRERLTWRFMAAVEFVFRSGRPRSMIDRILRDAIERCPDLAPHRSWIKAELRRGDASEIADAGRALGRYDARPFAGDVDVPTAVVVTTKDRLVRPRKQRALAKAVPGAEVLLLEGDHDVALMSVDEFAARTVAAVRSVASRAWQSGSSSSPAAAPASAS